MAVADLDRAPAVPTTLSRPTEDRVLAGVAAGVARRVHLEPALVRALFLAMAFTGVGLLAYVVAWAVLPEDGESRAPSTTSTRVAGGLLMAFGAVLLLARPAVEAGWADLGLVLLLALGAVLVLRPGE